MMYAEPQTLHLLLDVNWRTAILYLNAQIKAGAQSGDDFRHRAACCRRDYREFSPITCTRLSMV